jgi:hypothetical protein
METRDLHISILHTGASQIVPFSCSAIRIYKVKSHEAHIPLKFFCTKELHENEEIPVTPRSDQVTSSRYVHYSTLASTFEKNVSKKCANQGENLPKVCHTNLL